MSKSRPGEKYFLQGCERLEKGHADKAIPLLKQALKLEPKNQIYKIRLKEAEKKHKEKTGQGEIGEFSVMRIAIFALLFLAALMLYFSEQPEESLAPVDLASQHKSIKGLTKLIKTNEGAWVVWVEKNFTTMDTTQKRRFCMSIASRLPQAKIAVVAVHGSDGSSTSCVQN